MILFECYADQALLNFLGFKSKELKGGHSFGRSKLLGKLRKLKSSLALIDEDPGSAVDAYLKLLLRIRPRFYEDTDLLSFIDAKSGNQVIILRPDLERFIVKLSQKSEVNLMDFKLPQSAEDLHRILRLQRNEKSREDLKKFLRVVSQHRILKKLTELVQI